MSSLFKYQRWIHHVLVYSLLATISAASAAEFTWFRDVDHKEGWIEFTKLPSTGQNRVHVFPTLIGPNGRDPRAWIKGRTDGVAISFVIETPAVVNAQDFVTKVLATTSGLPAGTQSTNYQVDLPNVSVAEIRVVRDGQVLAKKNYDAKLPATTVGVVKVATTDQALRSAILNGDFELEADIVLPQATYSSLSVSIDQALASSYKIEALKTIITQQKVSGGKFFVFDWRRQSAQTAVTKSVNESKSSNNDITRSVVSVDADDDMLSKVESLLGFDSLTREKLISNHMAAAAQAEAAGKMDLAKIHREYAQKIDDQTPKVQAELLEKAIAAMSGDETSMAAFIGNGIAFSEMSGSTASRFSGLGVATSTGKYSNNYTELRLKTNSVHYLLTLSAKPSNTGTSASRWDEESATIALFDAALQSNVARARYVLAVGAAPNAVQGTIRHTPLMSAAANCDSDMLQLLLNAGANPSLRDSAGRNASQLATISGCPNLSAVIDNVPLASLNLKIGTAGDFQLRDFRIEEGGSISLPFKSEGSLKTTAGDHLLRLLVSGRLAVLDEEYQLAPVFYNALKFVGTGTSNAGPYRVYEIEDVVRLEVSVAGTSNMNKAIVFDPNTRMFGVANFPDDEPLPFDQLEHMRDDVHFRVGPIANVPQLVRQTCSQWEKRGYIEECISWH